MSLPSNDNSIEPTNPYQPVNVESDVETIGASAKVSQRWAQRLAQLGLVVGFGLSVVLGIQVIRFILLEEGLGGIATALGASLYTALIVTCVAGLPLAISGWIIGSLIDVFSSHNFLSDPRADRKTE